MELLAQAVDAIRANSYYLLAVNGNKPDEPRTVPRPGHAAESSTGTLSDFNALIGG